jgi:hypothetical protein
MHEEGKMDLLHKKTKTILWNDDVRCKMTKPTLRQHLAVYIFLNYNGDIHYGPRTATGTSICRSGANEAYTVTRISHVVEIFPFLYAWGKLRFS